MDTSVTVRLLDSALGHPIQTWKFDAINLIRIGRSSENEIAISDPTVSREHTHLVRKDDGWEAVSLGRNGTLVNGRAIDAGTRLNDKSLIRLGANGPAFEFLQTSVALDSVNTITNINLSKLPTLVVDEDKKRKEVDEIADSEIFKRLQQQAHELRRQRSQAETQAS